MTNQSLGFLTAKQRRSLYFTFVFNLTGNMGFGNIVGFLVYFLQNFTKILQNSQNDFCLVKVNVYKGHKSSNFKSVKSEDLKINIFCKYLNLKPFNFGLMLTHFVM